MEMIICRNLNRKDSIISIDEWFQKCPPEKGLKHWRDGRSAKELAKYWCNDISTTPIELKGLLEGHKDFTDIQIDIGSPEYETRFDQFGKGRIHDLLLIGEQNKSKVIIGIEAKVDESFGNDTVKGYYLKSILKRINGEGTNVPNRIEQLLTALFRKPITLEILDIMYQLIHSTAGLLAESKEQSVKKALFIVNNFVTENTNEIKKKENLTHLNYFVKNISDSKYNLDDDRIIGPLRVPGNDYIPSNVDLYIGKLDIFLSS